MAEAEEALVRSGEVGERDRAGRTSPTAAGPTPRASPPPRARSSARSPTPSAAARAPAALPIIGVAHGRPARLRRSARLGRHDEAREATERQAELAARLGVPECIALADHDAGLLALEAGDLERAERLLGRALAGDPPVQRAEARLRRAEALARLGPRRRRRRRDPRRHAGAGPPVPSPPTVLLARMTFAQALSARARGDHERAAKLLRRLRAPLAADSPARPTPRATISPRSSTSGGRR